MFLCMFGPLKPNDAPISMAYKFFIALKTSIPIISLDVSAL